MKKLGTQYSYTSVCTPQNARAMYVFGLSASLFCVLRQRPSPASKVGYMRTARVNALLPSNARTAKSAQPWWRKNATVASTHVRIRAFHGTRRSAIGTCSVESLGSTGVLAGSGR
jgi:hypothetical protein